MSILQKMKILEIISYKVHIISKHLRGVRQDRFIVIKDYDIDAIIAADEK